MYLVLVGTAPEGLLHGSLDVPLQRLGLRLLLLRWGRCCAEQRTRSRTKLYQNVPPVWRAACMRHVRFTTVCPFPLLMKAQFRSVAMPGRHGPNLEVCCSRHELPGNSGALFYAEAWSFAMCRIRCIGLALGH